ncbi:Acetyltransferase, ribosomal protein N-acetylase (modular protein) [Verrucomicrobia bacterium]|nr:Acetyltransferase, ribosomal protein N-acetylase (modular protein) [Verrucomicrobiota bacterium]
MRILFVENHAIFAKQVCALFLSAHAVEVVASLAAARKAVASENYDVLLVDYDLEDGKGDELVRACRVSHPGLRIIAVSAHVAGNTALLEAGASAVCAKMEFDKIQSVLEGPPGEGGTSRDASPVRKPAPGNALRAAGATEPSPAAAAQESGAAQPSLETARLILRPFSLDDAPTVVRQAGRREIADTTIAIPHPYPEAQARDWISRQSATWREGREIVFAIVLRSERRLIGAIGLREINSEHRQAELGFWIGVDWWGRGYATESARAVLGFGFQSLRLNRIYAHHMVRNPASGRVLEKIGMKKEGLLRERVRKWEIFEDVVILATLRSEWQGAQPP